MSIFNAPVIAWRLKSARNASRYDIRMRVALGFLFIFSLAISIWSSERLLQQLHQWQVQGPIATRLGLDLLCLFTWLGISAFAVLGAQRIVSSDEAILLFLQPLAPDVRFRTLFILFFIENQWYLMLIQLCVMSYVLIAALGWEGLLWLILLQFGIFFTALCGLIVSLLVMRYLLPREQRKACLGTLLVAGILSLLIILLRVKIASTIQTSLLRVNPELAIILFGLLLIGILGPLAGNADRLYSATLTTMQGQYGSRRALTLPGIVALKRLVERHRSLMAALFVRAIMRQSRSLMFWMRLAVILFVFALFPLVRTSVARFGFSDTFLVPIYAAGLSIAHILEQGPGAISGEGNRLAIYLTAPYTVPQILRSKLAVLLLPVLAEGLAMGLFLGWRSGLALSQAGLAIIAITLMVISCVTLIVLGGTWDEDLNLSVEGPMQELLQEEAPMTPRRIALFNLCLFSFGTMFVMLWKLPLPIAVLTLTVLTTGIVIVMWRFSCTHLYRILRS